jgi:nitrite reductase/ring-hydroxylating ferredoxin subunit/uncharacterized membrane protein
MRSRASYKGHPIHTALIPFPFAFINAAFFFDAAGWLFDLPSWRSTSLHCAVAGVITGLVAAVPGAIDYIYTVPPASTGKQRATRHLILNMSAVSLVLVSIVLHQFSEMPPVIVILIQLAAVVLLGVGSFMGGVLVTRNQISIDHRYAQAGKWKEVEIDARPDTAVTVARVDELKLNQMLLVRAGTRRIVVGRTENGYVAFDDRCTHRGGSLAGGAMICGTVQCPWHGSQFDVKTGAVKAGPAKETIGTYRVQEDGEWVRVTLPS